MTRREIVVMMEEELFPTNSLVLYKHRPARVLKAGGRIEIELEDGNKAKVRPKDIQLLHPGPIESLEELGKKTGEVELAWEILGDEPDRVLSISELAELIYGEYTSDTAWGTWEQVEDGLYFRGTPDSLRIRSPEEVSQEKASRLANAERAQRWNDFLDRVQSGDVDPEGDDDFLREVEEFAYGRRGKSRLLRDLKRGERPENAHALLLELGHWDSYKNPHPTRLGMASVPPEFELPPLPDEMRLDLTHLEAFAIDDRENRDPDDAISLEKLHFDEKGDFLSARIWVHVADAAALISPGSPADLEARERGATLYLAEGIVPMLPFSSVARLGMGLQETSPALSFGIQLNAAGGIASLEIKPSFVKVTRLSYEEAEARLEDEPLRGLNKIAEIYQHRRMSNGATFIDLPEVILRLVEGQVRVRPVPSLRSRELVREAMLMAGEAAAQFAVQNGLPFPFATQEAPDLQPISPGPPNHAPSPPSSGRHKGNSTTPEELVRHYSTRRSLKRSQVSGIPGTHAGVGLPAYSRVTSPLRRYLDLVAHQQLRAYLSEGQLLTEGEMLERLGASEAVTSRVSQAEALTRRHWTLVFLDQNPEWQGEGVVVEKTGTRNRVLIPEIMLEFLDSRNLDLPLGARITLASPRINLPELEVYFQYGPLLS